MHRYAIYIYIHIYIRNYNPSNEAYNPEPHTLIIDPEQSPHTDIEHHPTPNIGSSHIKDFILGGQMECQV